MASHTDYPTNDYPVEKPPKEEYPPTPPNSPSR